MNKSGFAASTASQMGCSLSWFAQEPNAMRVSARPVLAGAAFASVAAPNNRPPAVMNRRRPSSCSLIGSTHQNLALIEMKY
jgi:hypothetical protein